MNPQKHFKLSRQAMLLAAISAAFPVTGYCVAAGRVDFAIGNVEAVAADGSRHPVNKGTEINAGETINTATDARAQVRFADGGFISLQPNTVFRVDEFNYQNKADGQEKGFFSLLKGGLRAITGVIGHANKETYQVRTPAATLGIRGTGYNMALRDDGLFVNVGEGAISLNNNAGILVVVAGGAAFVANFNTAPVPTTQLPYTPPQGLQEPTFTVADNRGSSGNLTILPGLVSGPGYTLAYTSWGGSCFDCNATSTINGLTGVTATFSASGQLVGYDNGSVNGALSTGAVTFFATDGIIGWGRWDGEAAGTNPLVNNIQGITPTVHFVVGIPTAAMPTTGTATYSLMGYTNPTATDGSTNYAVNGTLTANFAPIAAAPNVVVNMTVGNSTSNTYVINGSATITGSTFSNGFIATTGSNCLSCTTSVNGFFAGTNASRAGLSYAISNASGPNNIQGVAAFTKN